MVVTSGTSGPYIQRIAICEGFFENCFASILPSGLFVQKLLTIILDQLT